MDLKCPLCTYSSESITLLHVHCVKAHPKEFFTCPWCTIPFESLRFLQNHATKCDQLDVNKPRERDVNSVLVNGDKCLVCEGRFPSNEATIKHYKEQHLNFSYICHVCELYFQHSANLELHYTTCLAKSHASKAFESSHTTINRSNNENCGDTHSAAKKTKKKIILKNTSMSYKRNVMKTIKENHCMICEIDFSNKLEIIDHFQAEHKTTLFVCGECNQSYMQKASLYTHQKMKHTGEENLMQNSEKEQITTAENETTTQACNQPIIKCPMCVFHTPSPVLIAAHLIEHTKTAATHIKMENVNNIDVSSTSAHQIKQESIDNWFSSKLNNEPRPTPTDGGFVDLSLDG